MSKKELKQSLQIRNLIAEQPVTGDHTNAFRFAAKLFLIRLSQFIKDDATCYHSYDDLERVIGCSDNYLTEIKNYWLGEKVFTWVRGSANQNKKQSNTYTFDVAAMEARLQKHLEVVEQAKATEALADTEMKAAKAAGAEAWNVLKAKRKAARAAFVEARRKQRQEDKEAQKTAEEQVRSSPVLMDKRNESLVVRTDGQADEVARPTKQVARPTKQVARPTKQVARPTVRTVQGINTRHVSIRRFNGKARFFCFPTRS